MSAMATDYDWQRNVLLVSSPAIPTSIRLHKQDEREREVYTAKVYEYVPKPDVVSYEEGFADGFDRGEEAIVQQIDGILSDGLRGDDEKVRDLIRFVKDFWKERES